MDQRQLEALIRKNAAKAASQSPRKGFGKKYDINRKDDPADEASLRQREESERFFKEMKAREF